MSKELFLKYANSSQYNKKKCYALKSWCDKQNNVFPLLEVFDCLYNAANGNRDELTKLIEQLTAKDKTFGRSSTVFGVDNPHMYIIRNEEGDIEIRGYNPNFSGNPIGQHQVHEPSIIRKDGQMKKNVIKSREKLVDLGQEVRKIYQGQSNELLTCAIRAIKKFASEHKISEMTVVDRIKKGVYMLDTSEGLDNGKIVSKMKSIKLTESQINEIAEVTKLTEYKFYNNVQRFLSDLLRDPVNAKVPFLLQANNITRNQLLYYLKSLDIIKRHEKIKDRDSQGNPITAKMVVRYSVPKKDFTKKMKKLFISLVAKNVPNKKEKALDECDGGAAPACGTADCSGQYSQPLFGVQRRKMPNEIDETTTASNVIPNGDTSMGIAVPFASDDETRDRTPEFSVERQDESVDEMNVFHASKANFNKFNHRKNLGSGAGSQVFGYGSYFTNDDAVAQGYVDSFKSPHLTEEELDAIKEECRNGLSEVDTATLDLFEDLGDVWTASDAKDIISKAKGILEEVDDCVKRVKTNFEVFAHQWCSYHMDNWNIVLYNQIIAPLHFILKHDWNENDVKIVLIQRNNETVPISEITNEEYKSLCEYIIGLFESSQRISQRIIELIQNSNYFKERKAYKYNVNIPDEENDNYLDWYKPLSENAYSRIVNGLYMLCKKWKNQTKLFQLKGTFVDDRNNIIGQNFGKIYQQISRWLGNQKMFSMILQYCGFDGIKYEAGTKWGKPDGSREDGYNYVLFDANKAKINNVQEYEE